ncbi:MAG: hypothetical protein FWG70_07300 [Oscillospiraceae bacterium]|nr:hypothetical protein [Oscillospiraceae bacterium]
MRFSLSLKTLLRTPVKTAVTFLLIAAASFALFSRVTDYAVTSREMKQTENYYNGVVALDNGVPDTANYQYSNMPATVNMVNPWLPTEKYFWDYATPNPLTKEQLEKFGELSETATSDIRYMTGGIIRDYKRLSPRISDSHDWGYDYTSRFVIEATYADYRDRSSVFISQRMLNFTDIKNLAGEAQFEDGETISLLFDNFSDSYVTDRGLYYLLMLFDYDEGGTAANSFTAEANSIYMFFKSPYKSDYAYGLTSGNRYLIIGTYIPNTFDKDSYESIAEELRMSMVEDFKSGTISSGKTLPDGTTREMTLEEIEEMAEKIELVPLEDTAESILERFGDYDFKRFMVEGKSPMRPGDMDTFDYVPSIFELGENYLETEEYTRALEIAEITNQDLHTFDIVYTRNMESIPRFNEGAMIITDGRMIVPEDENSCVVSQYFFDAYDLNIGDKLTIELGDRLFEQNAQMGAITYIPERKWNVAEIAELEIVGVYYDTDPDYERNATHFWGYSPNTIFVPLSLLPVTPPADYEVKPGEFSLLIENPHDISAFLELATPLAEEMGLNLRISDGGYANVQKHLSTSIRTSLITALLYIFGALLALVLAAYLFIGRGKLTYAIMRSLGTPHKKAGNALSIPLGLLAAFAIPVGGTIGLIYTTQIINYEYIMNTTLPVGIIILCLICELAFIAVLTAFFLKRLSKKSPLSLLQGDIIRIAEVRNFAETNKITNERFFASSFENSSDMTSTHSVKQASTPKYSQKYSAFSHVSSYIFRHMRRVKWKTAISLALVFVLTGGLGVLALTHSLYRELFKTVDVISSATGFDSNAIEELNKSELVQDLYFYSDFEVSVNLSEIGYSHTVTNDIERYLQGDYVVEYADGFSSEIFQENNALCVVGSGLAEVYELKAGDEITLMKGDLLYALNQLYFGNEEFRNMMRRSWDMEEAAEEEFEESLTQYVQELILAESIPYKIAGIIKTENYSVGNSVFTPSGESAVALHSFYNDDFYIIKYSQIILSDNERLPEFTVYLEELKGENREAFYITDTTELENIKRVRDLLTLLFPIAVTAAVLIGLTAPALLILQSSKEAAILRVLGTTKKRVRCMLTIEQVALCIIGIILAAGGLLVYNYSLFTQSAETLALCGVLYLLGCVCAGLAASVSVTKRKVLELLQVKE